MMLKSLLVMAMTFSLVAQTKVNLSRQGKTADFRSLGSTYPFQTGTILPATCSIGQVFFKTDAPAGQNAFFCVQADTWLSQGSALNVLSGGVPVAQKSVVDFTAGPGTTIGVVDAGSAIVVTPSADLAVLQTRASAQAGTALSCAPASNSPQHYSCHLTPTLTAYQPGMILHLRPDATNSGAVTLNVDTLGQRPLRKWDGLAEFRSGDLPAGTPVPVYYDGTVFRAMFPVAPNPAEDVANCVPASASGVAYDCALAKALTAYSTGILLNFRPDVTNTGAVTLNVDALGPKPLRRWNGVGEFYAGELPAGTPIPVYYDGTVFRALYPVAANPAEDVANCVPGSASGVAYACALPKSLNAYSAGIVLNFRPDVTNAEVTPTLNVDSLGAKALTQPDGVSTLEVSALLPGANYPVWYDGSGFRLIYPILPKQQGETRPTCSAALQGRFWFIPGPAVTKDSLAVCAKDDADSFAWRTLY